MKLLGRVDVEVDEPVAAPRGVARVAIPLGELDEPRSIAGKSTRSPGEAPLPRRSAHPQGVCEQGSLGAAQIPQLGLQHTWPTLHVFIPQRGLNGIEDTEHAC